MIASILASITVCSGVVVIYGLLRRRAPRLETDDIQKWSDMPDGIHVVHTLTEEERNMIKEAFLAGPDFRWITLGGDKNRYDKIDDEKDVKNHRDVAFYMLECVLKYAERYGIILVCRDSDGSFLGSICLDCPYPSSWQRNLHFMYTVVPLGIPVPQKLGRGPGSRFDAYVEGCEKAHEDIMKDERGGYIPHWYVGNLGVSSAAQGRGVGRRLLKAASVLASESDSGSSPVIYLECHDGNVPFYEKMGYTKAETFLLQAKSTTKDPAELPHDTTASFRYNGMVLGLNRD